jgi:hypothetical protein
MSVNKSTVTGVQISPDSGPVYADPTFWCISGERRFWDVVPEIFHTRKVSLMKWEDAYRNFSEGGTLHQHPHEGTDYTAHKTISCLESAAEILNAHIWGTWLVERKGFPDDWGPPGQGLPFCPRCFYGVYPEDFLSMTFYRYLSGESRWGVTTRVGLRVHEEDVSTPVLEDPAYYRAGTKVPHVHHVVMYRRVDTPPEPGTTLEDCIWDDLEVVCANCFFQVFPEYAIPPAERRG